jgi:hypothetical protein
MTERYVFMQVSINDHIGQSYYETVAEPISVTRQMLITNARKCNMQALSPLDIHSTFALLSA